jgi:hypothetical protein
MNFKNFTKNKFVLIIPLVIFISLVGIIGCDDSGVTTEEPPAGDSNVVIYKNVAAFYWQRGSNDTSYMGINLLEGDSTRQVSTSKDMELIDSVNSFHNFYFRSGDISLVAIGYKTRFNRPYRDMTSDKFDTLSVIPDSDTLLTPNDFTQNDTYGGGDWGYFNFNQTTQPVYGFYLQGRNTGNKYIYGVFHVKSIDSLFTVVPDSSAGIKATIDIKLNTAGNNHFVVQ